MASKGYLYRYEGGKFVPYEVISREEVLVGKTDEDAHLCDGKKWMMKVAKVAEDEAVPHYKLKEMGIYGSIEAIVTDLLADKAYEEVTKQRKAGMLSGNQIAKFEVARKEFEALTAELFDSFQEFVLNPELNGLRNNAKGQKGGGDVKSAEEGKKAGGGK